MYNIIRAFMVCSHGSESRGDTRGFRNVDLETTITAESLDACDVLQEWRRNILMKRKNMIHKELAKSRWYPYKHILFLMAVACSGFMLSYPCQVILL